MQDFFVSFCFVFAYFCHFRFRFYDGCTLFISHPNRKQARRKQETRHQNFFRWPGP